MTWRETFDLRAQRTIVRLLSADLRSKNSPVAAGIKRIVEEELERERRSVHIYNWDPLRRQADDAEAVLRALRESCNHVGQEVIVEDGVVLVGGKYPGGVGLHLGNGTRVYGGCHLVIDQVSPESGIVLGSGCSLNYNCYIEGSGGVELGSGTIVGPNVVILSSRHKIQDELPITASGKDFCHVTLGRDVWVGANAVILAGVVVGDGAVIGAASVVTRDVASGSVVAGSPARVLTTKGAAASSGRAPVEGHDPERETDRDT